MKKELLLADGKLIFTKNNGYCTDVITIEKGYFINNVINKILRMTIWDDISFIGYSFDHNINIIDFEFDINDPIYFCFNRLLGSNLQFVIDDDDTYGIMKKYMIITKEINQIKVSFINNLSQEEKEKSLPNEKFNIFIKNIGPDPRSKIEDFDIKLRIYNFFKDCENVLFEEYHQVTIDEYLEIIRYNNELEKKKEKKLVK